MEIPGDAVAGTVFFVRPTDHRNGAGATKQVAKSFVIERFRIGRMHLNGQ
jgi:hypothetical protein